MGASAVILSLLSTLNIRFSFSLEKRCWNGYRLMNCRLDKSVCVCVCLWPVACEKWRLWLGLEGAAEPWASLPHTHCFSFDAQFIICLLLDVLRVHVYSIWNYTEHTSWMSVRFIPWASGPPPPPEFTAGAWEQIYFEVGLGDKTITIIIVI